MEKAGDLDEERTDSECSSGCQSGWTLYLGQSSQKSFTTSIQLRTEEEEDDLSMVSDASSGPQVVRENINCCICNDSLLALTEVAKYDRDKRRRFEEEKQKRQYSCGLEDTASSSLFPCYKAINTIRSSSKKKLHALEQSPNFAESHFKKKSELQKQLGNLHSFCSCESSTDLQRRR